MNKNKTRQKLVLSGSSEAIEYLQTLFQSGELSKLLDVNVLNISITSEKTPTEVSLVNLSQCLQKNFVTAIAAGFEVIQDILEPPQLVLGYQRRSTRSSTSGESDEYIRLQSAQRLLETNPDNSTAIATLFEIIRTTQEEEVRWRAIESLPKNARHRLTDVIGLKKEELRLANHPIKLTVSAIKISDEEVSVFIKLYPAGEQTTLPIGIKLIVLDESGKIFDQVPNEDEEYDEIKYKLICNLGEIFSVRVALGSDSITESFSF
ncbi:DUF1822 family protein [Brasilonema bromeliae]|nr:DUF1822 family protein [Brasilonema bromeliae]